MLFRSPFGSPPTDPLHSYNPLFLLLTSAIEKAMIIPVNNTKKGAITIRMSSVLIGYAPLYLEDLSANIPHWQHGN